MSVMIESGWFGHVSRAYAGALTLEGLLLAAFTISSGIVTPREYSLWARLSSKGLRS